MRQTQKRARAARKSANLPRPAIWCWPVDGRQFGEQLELLKRHPAIHEALAPLLAAAAPQFILDFAAHDDREMALAAWGETLIRLAYATVRGAAPKRSTYEMHWLIDEENEKPKPAVAAARMKSLVRLAGRIEHMADEIQRVNTWPLFAFAPSCAQARDTGVHLLADMRPYAKILRARVKRNPSYAKPIRYLVETVVERTGRTQPSKIAKLLLEVALALDLALPYTAQDISNILRRRKDARNI